MSVKVSVVKCRTYNPEEVQGSVRKAVDLVGGMLSFVQAGDKVLIKPNLLSGRGPEDGVNTHVEVVRTVVKLVKECSAVPVIGDNPGGSLSPKQVYESSGIKKMADEEGVRLAEVEGVKVVNGLPIASYFFECDKIITLPKMKTHNLMTLTGAVKNMYGAIAGLNKSEMHKKFPKPEDFVGVIIDVFRIVKPNLALMDGVVAMDGDGPAAGRFRNAGVLICSRDSVAVDSVFSYLIGMNPMDLYSTKEAVLCGLGEADLSNIELVGDKVEKGFVKDFKVPGLKGLFSLPDPVIKFLAGFIKFRPYISEKICKKCGICSETCPVSAITISESMSVIDYNKCIRCLCCNEVCPYKAVELKRNILARIFGL